MQWKRLVGEIQAWLAGLLLVGSARKSAAAEIDGHGGRWRAEEVSDGGGVLIFFVLVVLVTVEGGGGDGRGGGGGRV